MGLRFTEEMMDDRRFSRVLRGLALLLPLIGAAACVPPVEAAGTVVDCRADSPACPEVRVEADPWAALPGFGPSPFRGYGDPSVRKDPKSDRLWMSYSYLDVRPEPEPAFAVSIHLASSDDAGASWQFRRTLERSQPERDAVAGGGRGLSIHEVSTLTPLEVGSRVRWFGMHLRYFQPFGSEGRRPQSFHLQLARGSQPKYLGRRHKSRLTGPLTDPAWGSDLDLSSLDRELKDCAVWTEPSLFGKDETLYLVAQCLVVQRLTGARRPNKEFLGVFSSDGVGPVEELDWRWRGKLTERSDAKTLGGQVLTQADLAWGRDGSLLLLVTPKRLKPTERHLGCRVLEVESLDEPALRRVGGAPVVRAEIHSSDSTGLGPGLCAYDPASSTGVLFVRTEIDITGPDVVFRLHATGVHP